MYRSDQMYLIYFYIIVFQLVNKSHDVILLTAIFIKTWRDKQILHSNLQYGMGVHQLNLKEFKSLVKNNTLEIRIHMSINSMLVE